MEDFFYNQLGISPNVLNYFILPFLIFLARIGDVSISTIRIIFVMNGNRLIAPILGFFEALIWLLAIGQIFNNIDNVLSYIAYAAGFATGTFVGMTIEARLAYGKVVMRLFIPKPVDDLRAHLNKKNYRYSIFEASGRDGKVNLVFLVVKRDKLPVLIGEIDKLHPKAFFTIEGVKQVSEEIHLKSDRSFKKKVKRRKKRRTIARFRKDFFRRMQLKRK